MGAPSVPQLLADSEKAVLIAIGDGTEKILRQREALISSAEANLVREMESRHKELIKKLESKDAKGWQLAMALFPVLATALLGVLVFYLQKDTNEKIDRASKLLSTRLALSQQFYQQRFTVYQDADRRMVLLLAAVNNLERNPDDLVKKKEAADVLVQLYGSSRTNSFYMTPETSKGLAQVWSIGIQLPQLMKDGGTGQISDLDAAISEVEAQMRKELLVNIESVDEETGSSKGG
ncbi:MAG TPA: hypothetical protein VN950_15140 [Terriglobales bacterium]|nr:hypothetical protein [Terriglobales bacterium]